MEVYSKDLAALEIFIENKNKYRPFFYGSRDFIEKWQIQNQIIYKNISISSKYISHG